MVITGAAYGNIYMVVLSVIFFSLFFFFVLIWVVHMEFFWTEIGASGLKPDLLFKARKST